MTSATAVSARQEFTPTAALSRESFEFYRSRGEAVASRGDELDETSNIEADEEFYTTIITRLETFGEVIAVEEVLGDLDSD